MGRSICTRRLVHSCDVYFYTVGQRMGIDTMAAFANQFGLGKETGVELPSERIGIVPSTAWKQKAKNEPWLPGETISAAIGQGYVTVTPLQMASLIGTVANDGVSIARVWCRRSWIERSGNLQELPAVPRGKMNVKPETFALIKEALADVVTKGTATKAKSSLVTIGGKTGTAQMAALRTGPEKNIPKKFRDHAWFVAFAPVENAARSPLPCWLNTWAMAGPRRPLLPKKSSKLISKLTPQIPAVTSDLSRRRNNGRSVQAKDS